MGAGVRGGYYSLLIDHPAVD